MYTLLNIAESIRLSGIAKVLNHTIQVAQVTSDELTPNRSLQTANIQVVTELHVGSLCYL